MTVTFLFNTSSYSCSQIHVLVTKCTYTKKNDVNSSNDGFKNILYQILDTLPLNETKHKCIQQQCSKMGRDTH